MNKSLDLSKTVYQLVKENPEVLEIMKELGFGSIAKPGMLNTAGRFMTIPKGAVMKGLDLGKIRAEFVARGYDVED